MDRNALPMPAPAAEGGAVAMSEAEAASPPPLYRSEGFAEDLLDGEAAVPAHDRRARWPIAWLYAMPLATAMVGALAFALAGSA